MPNVKLLLNENVAKLGKVGDLVDVKPGYARNYLIPNGLASIPNLSEVRRIKKKRDLLEKKYQEEKTLSEQLAKKFEGLDTLTFELKANDEGKTFGSITSKQVAEEIKAKFEVEVNRKDIDMKKTLTAIGKHIVTVRLHPEVEVQLNIVIKKILDEKEAEAEAKLKKSEKEKAEAENEVNSQ